jgi:hypothetical protein
VPFPVEVECMGLAGVEGRVWSGDRNLGSLGIWGS